jgi:aspartate/methionine/tyrosine aminotransferase
VHFRDTLRSAAGERLLASSSQLGQSFVSIQSSSRGIKVAARARLGLALGRVKPEGPEISRPTGDAAIVAIMSRPTLRHIAWSETEVPRHRFTLAESGVEQADLEAMGLPSRGGLPAAGYAIQPELERKLGERYGAPGGRVLLAAGGSEANAIVFVALLGRDDEVLVESPGYEPLRVVPQIFGHPVRQFARLATPSVQSLVARIEAALTPATRMVVLSHLHNPSGTPLTPAEARELNDLAERRNLWIHCDEIFRDALEGPTATHATMGPRWVVTSSLTKVYGLGGLRMGWVAGSADVLTRCAEAQDALSAEPALPSIALTLELMPHLDVLRARTLGFLTANHARWRERLSGDLPCAPAFAARGTTLWLVFGLEGDGNAFASFASEHYGLAVTPGRFFGDSRGVRVGFAYEPARFALALDALEQALAAFRAREPIRENA